jgi:hypothetical protein
MTTGTGRYQAVVVFEVSLTADSQERTRTEHDKTADATPDIMSEVLTQECRE